jgi:hypothetical protein
MLGERVEPCNGAGYVRILWSERFGSSTLAALGDKVTNLWLFPVFKDAVRALHGHPPQGAAKNRLKSPEPSTAQRPHYLEQGDCEWLVRYLDGESYKTIATAAGVSTDTVKTRVPA